MNARKAALVGFGWWALACSGQTAPSSSQAPDGGSGGGVDGSASALCARANVDDLRVVEEDLYAFPPYAVDACTLVYVSASGELRERDLSTGSEATVAPASDRPRRPALAGPTLAWEADEGGARIVRVRHEGATATIKGSFARTGEPRVASGAVVVTGWLTSDERGDTDVALYDAATKTMQVVGGGPGQQRFADISATHIAYSDFSEDPDGRFDDNETDLADVVIVERATSIAKRRSLPGKQAFPMLASAGELGYLSWGDVHPEPKFTAFKLVAGRIDGDGSTDVLLATVQSTASVYIRPSARAGIFEWVDRPGGKATLWRASLARPAPVAALAIDGTDLYAPAAGASLSVIAARASGTAAPALRILAR